MLLGDMPTNSRKLITIQNMALVFLSNCSYPLRYFLYNHSNLVRWHCEMIMVVIEPLSIHVKFHLYEIVKILIRVLHGPFAKDKINRKFSDKTLKNKYGYSALTRSTKHNVRMFVLCRRGPGW